MSERRSDPVDIWRNVTDAVAGGLRRTFDYQRSLADDYGRWVADRPQRDRTGGSEDWTELRSGLASYGSTVFELTADYYRDLADVATRFVEEAYPKFAGDGRATTDYGPDGRRPQRATIDVRGSCGHSVSARFSIENSDDEPAEVLIEAGTFRGPGGERFAAPIELSPDALVIAPHSSDNVVATVDLAPPLFVAGGRYSVPISVHGPKPAIIDIEIAVADDTDDDRDDRHDYAVRCPSCRRTFERTTPSLVLRPHNDGDGHPCPERSGTRVS